VIIQYMGAADNLWLTNKDVGTLQPTHSAPSDTGQSHDSTKIFTHDVTFHALSILLLMIWGSAIAPQM
jgi:hypothetical protein